MICKSGEIISCGAIRAAFRSLAGFSPGEKARAAHQAVEIFHRQAFFRSL
jgi:hypothetical protein